MKYDNPAERLMVILAAGLKRKETEACITVWHDLLGSGGDNALLMGRLGKAMELPRQIIAGLQEADPDGEPTWHHWSRQVDKAFLSQNLSSSWQSFRQHIDTNTVYFLRLSSQLLHSKLSTELLITEKLTEIRQQINTLIVEVSESGDALSVDVKKYIVAHLKKVLNAIDEYKITGAITMLESVEVMWGHMASDADYRKVMLTSDLGSKLMNTLEIIANVVTVATGIPQISPFVAMLTAK